MHILQYIPRKTTPYIYYTTSRELPKHVLLPLSVYEDQRERMLTRIKAIQHYAFGSETCRVRIMLEYFGEKNATSCNTCDICRNKRQIAKTDTKKLSETIIRTLTTHPCTINELNDIIKVPQATLVETIRLLIADKELKLLPEGTITLNKQRPRL